MSSSRSAYTPLILAGLLTWSIGCGPTWVMLKPLNPMPALPNLGGTRSTAVGSTIRVREFRSPEKGQSNLIGEARTGVANSYSDIYSKRSSGDIVKRAIHASLLRGGLAVVEDSSATVVIDGTVEEFWVDEYVTGYSAEYSRASVRFDLVVRRGNQITWASSYEGLHKSELSMETTPSNHETLERALEIAMEGLMADSGFVGALAE